MVYESSRIFEKPFKHLFAEVARGCSPCLGMGGLYPISLFSCVASGGAKGKKVFRGHPDLRQRAAALCTPAFKKAIRTFQVPEKFGMTHTSENCQKWLYSSRAFSKSVDTLINGPQALFGEIFRLSTERNVDSANSSGIMGRRQSVLESTSTNTSQELSHSTVPCT